MSIRVLASLGTVACALVLSGCHYTEEEKRAVAACSTSGGSDLNGSRDWDAPVPPVIAGNSDSVNRTLIDAMGLRMPSMPYMAPGIENPLLRQQEVEQILQNNGLPIPKGGLF